MSEDVFDKFVDFLYCFVVVQFEGLDVGEYVFEDDFEHVETGPDVALAQFHLNLHLLQDLQAEAGFPLHECAEDGALEFEFLLLVVEVVVGPQYLQHYLVELLKVVAELLLVVYLADGLDQTQEEVEAVLGVVVADRLVEFQETQEVLPQPEVGGLAEEDRQNLQNLPLHVYRAVLLRVYVYLHLVDEGFAYLLVGGVVAAGNPVQDFNLLVLRVVPPLDLLEDDVLVDVLVFVDRREGVGSVDHDPPEAFVGLFAFP